MILNSLVGFNNIEQNLAYMLCMNYRVDLSMLPVSAYTESSPVQCAYFLSPPYLPSHVTFFTSPISKNLCHRVHRRSSTQGQRAFEIMTAQMLTVSMMMPVIW